MRTFNPEKIKIIRNGLGLTMDQFAKKIDPSLRRQHIYSWEHGKSMPSMRNLGRIATALGIQIDVLFTN